MVEKIGTERLFEQLQDCYSFKEAIAVNFLNFQYKEVLKRKENGKAESISSNNLSIFLNLPICLAERIHKIFSPRNKENFIRGMHNLYFGSFETIIGLTFKIFDLSDSQKIYKSDVLNILNLLTIDTIFLGNLKEIVGNFFNGKPSLVFQEYKDTILTNNSDIFVILLLCIYQNQPFSKPVFEEFIINFNNDFKYADNSIIQNKLITKKEEIIFEYSIAKPSIEFSINYEGSKKVTSINQLVDDTSIIDYADFFDFDNLLLYNNKTKLSSKNSNDESTETYHTANSICCDIKTSTTKLSSSNLNLNETFTIYKLKNNLIVSYQASLVQDTLVIKSTSLINNSTIIKDIIHLPSLFIDKGEDINLGDRVYSPVRLTNKYINTYVPRVFYFKCNLLRDKFYKKLRDIIKIRKIYKEFIFKKEIGKGSFGKVYLAEEINNSNTQFAIKKIKKDFSSVEDSKFLISELNIIKFLIHNKNENIINVLDVYESKNSIYIVMEYCDLGDLGTILTGKERKYLDYIENNQGKIANEITNGLQFLHKNGIIHRDLKPFNILIKKEKDQLSIKISDFGLARFIGQTQNVNEFCGSLIYSPPEILKHVKYGLKADVWSYGILLFILFYGEFPFIFNKLTQEQLAFEICYRDFNFPERRTIDKDIELLVSQCLTKSSNERVSINSVVKSKIFLNDN